MIDGIPVKVFVRSRPFSERECLENAQECLQVFVESNQVSCNGKMFAFDGVLDSSTPQDTVYDVTSSFLLEQFFRGFNCTVLAYGQTGSGKTFTMGTEETTASMMSEKRGIIPRLVEAIFRQISESGIDTTYRVLVSMLEIYDEKVHDLLSGMREPLQVREQGGSVFVQGLSKNYVTNLTETMAQLERGGSQRSKGQTAMNAQSSRSHAIFTISLEKVGIGDEDNSFTAKLHLVDLAGSERLKKTQAEGTRKMEGIRINEGLLALGNVISALSEPGNNRHIPYRDSKITRLLQDSLGGNSYTVMIACVSPADSNAEETLSTLRYADRAKKIKNKPVVNVDSGQQKINELKEKVASLERELAEARMGFAPCRADSDISAFEIDQIKSCLAEKDELLKTARDKTAEAIYQKTTLWNQIQNLEGQRERFKLALTQALEIIESRNAESSDQILQRISEIITQDILEEEERDLSICKATHLDTDDEILDDTFSTKFVDKQTNLDRELGDVMQQIKDKEELLIKAVENQKKVDELMKQHKEEMASLQQRTDAILAEKSKLELELKKISTNNRLAEERRRKLLDMEKQLAQMRKQMTDMKKLEKQKLHGEEMQKQMQLEIVALKQAKVRMVKQQREEAEKYRQWKMKHDKELIQVKQKERKRDIEAAREKRSHDQQMMICKQKLEEAKRINKRLFSQMERSAAVARERQNEISIDQAKRFVEVELSLIGSSYEAEQMCQSLKDQRRRLGLKKSRLMRHRECYVSPDEPLKKRRSTEEGAALSTEDNDQLQRINEDLRNIDHQQMLCSDELNKLQRGCGSIDFESRAESRWKDVLTIASARVYLKVLFEQAANERKMNVEQELELERLRNKNNDLEMNFRLEKKALDGELGTLRDCNRKLLLEYQKQMSQAEMQLLNLTAIVSTTKSIDGGTVKEFKHLYDNLERLNQMGKQLESSQSRRGTSKGLMRSRSSSCMESANADVLTTEEERRTRASRARIQRYGDVKNPIMEVEADSDEEQSIADVSYHPRIVKRRPTIVTDLSPILDLTKSGENVHDGNISPRSRRLSMHLLRPPSQVVEIPPDKENILRNETFVMHGQSADSADVSNMKAPDLENPARNATLVSGLEPHFNPTLGPL